MLHYLKFKIISKGRHGTHSPFVYGLLEKVFPKIQSKAYDAPQIESVLHLMQKSKETLRVIDFKLSRSRELEMRYFAKKSTSTLKFRKLLTLMCDHIEITSALEAGTALGISAAYLAQGQFMQQVHTLDGNTDVIAVAKKSFDHLGKITFHCGDVLERFGKLAKEVKPQLVFLDADHRGTTIDYYLQCLQPVMRHIKVIIIHDIYWSPDMYDAWKKHRNTFPISIDIFQAGLLFPNIETPTQQFCLKF